MNSARRSLILRMEHARDFELAVRAAYLELAARGEICGAFQHVLVCHGERSAVQAARIERQLALATGRKVQMEADALGVLPRASVRLAHDALDLADDEIAMYRECRRLAADAQDASFLHLCEDLLEEETGFRAVIAGMLERLPASSLPPRLAETPAGLAAPAEEPQLCIGAS